MWTRLLALLAVLALAGGTSPTVGSTESSAPAPHTRAPSTGDDPVFLPARASGPSADPGPARFSGPAAGAGAAVRPAPPDVRGVDPGPGAEPDPIVTSEGFHVSPGAAAASHGPPDGPLVSYTVEREPGVDEDLLRFNAVVEESLHDPRSWGRRVRLQRVADPAAADIRVLLATPGTVDRLCAEAGLDTAGRYSCWNGRFAALNAWRWQYGATDFEELTSYRRYLVNHEFGHGLGRGHVACPGTGHVAPVMMQQSMSTGPCVANPWPYPDDR